MRRTISVFVTVALMAGMAMAQANKSQAQANNNQPQANADQGRHVLGGTEPQQRIQREVLHELLMLPYYSIFDDLRFEVNGSTVTLMGSVIDPVTKSDAANAVKHIEGVQKVVNDIKALPPSPMDNQIRRAEYRAIFGSDGLYRYAMGAVPDIHIIVDQSHVKLVGIVSSQSDKQIAGIRAASVPGVLGKVQNDLQVVNNNKSGD